MSEFPHEELCRILQSTDRTHDDVQFIYENIQKLQFFKDFFTENMAATSMESILALCEGFTYEKSAIGKYVLKKGDTSNDKFYVILSGQVAVVLPENDVPSLTKDDNSLIKETENNTLRNVDQRSIIKLQTAGNISFSKMNTIDLEGTPSDKGRKNDGKVLMSAMSSEFSPAVKPIRILRTSTLSEVQVERSPSIRSKRASRRTGFFHRSISMANDGSVESGFESFVTSPQLGVVREEENAPSLLKLNQIMEEEIPFDLEDDYKFEEYANKHGNIVRYLEKGETFGELALQNSNARSASILCRTDCEFLVGTKQQFEVMFERRDQEKERFFKSSFPLLANIVVSTAGFNYFLSTYKPEVFTKGTYLMNEGRVKKKDAKLYIIVKGECLIERTLIFEVSSPYNKAQSIAKNVMSVRLAVVGKGSVIGEELLLTRNNYRYSVKVTSDNLHVYAVTKEDFETKNFKEFRDHIIGLCRIKNEQRENIFENALREQEAKTQQYKAGNVYCIKNAAMQPLLIKPAMHGLSRYMHREQKVIDSTESPLASFFMTTMPGTKENSLSPPKNEEKSVSILDTDFSATKVLRSMKDKKRNAELSEIFHERDQSLEAKLAFLDRIPDFNKKSKDFSNPKEFENLRLFTENENSQTKSKKFLLKKPEKVLGNESSADNTIISKATGDSKGIDSTVQWMLKELTRCKRKHRYSSSQEIEPKQISQMPQLPQIQIQKAEDKGQGPIVEEAQRNTPGSAIFSMRKNSAVVLESTKNLKSSTPSITDLQTLKPTTASTPALRIPIYPKGYLIAKPFALAAKKETTLSTEASPLTTETPASAKMKLVQASDITYQEQERRPRNPGHSSFYKTHTDSLLNLKSIEQSDIEDSPTNNQKYKSFYIHTPDVSPCRNGSAQSPEKNQRLHSLGHSQSKSNLRRNRIRFYNPIEERKKFFEHPYIGAKPKVKKISAKNLLMVMSPTSAGSNLLNKK